MAAAGFLFCLANAVMRVMALELHPFQTQFLRYLAGLIVLLPLVLRTGLLAWRPFTYRGQIWRGAVHTAGLLLWFMALPHVSLADMTAIGFTGPIFIMLGAVLFLREKVVPQRWAAAIAGAIGVGIVVAPQLSGVSGAYTLVMLASAPLFGASFLITKALTRYDRPEVIVAWQAISVSLMTLPFALPDWIWPTVEQCGWFLLCGLLGSAGHYCLTQAFRLADMSATQPIKFLDLLWASALGFLIFGDIPTTATLAGAAIIFASTTWITRYEALRIRAASSGARISREGAGG